MKKFIVILIGICMVVFVSGVSANGYYGRGDYGETAKAKEKPKLPDTVTKGFDKKIAPQCPYTLIQQHESDINTCQKCHVGTHWKIKEERPDIQMDYPYGGNTKIVGEMCDYKIQGAIDLSAMDKLTKLFVYLAWHPEVKKVNIGILSGGGDLFVAWQMVTIIESHKAKYKITTKIPGFAASAAFMLFCAGDIRLVYKHAILMWHEMWSFKMFSFDTVSSSEEKARVFRKLQDNVHSYLVARSILTKEQLDEYVKGVKDYWMTGTEALDVGFATGLIK